MRNTQLADLNFRELVNYGGQPPVRNTYSAPLRCHGFCISCEEAGLLHVVGGHLELMSHGCDSADFVAILGAIPPRHGTGVRESVLFVLEDPGADYGNGAPVEFRGIRKQPPVNHYYWTPNVTSWPTRVVAFNGNFYGPYFAYLMRRHQLLNVYITNLVKCKWTKGPGDPSGTGDTSRIVRHCTARYLTREVEMCAPRVAFCFGRAAESGFRELARRIAPRCDVVYLIHPAFIHHRAQTVGRTQAELVQQNDRTVAQALARIA